MNKFGLIIVPVWVLCSGVSFTSAPEPVHVPQVELRTISGHMTSLKREAPANLTFAGMPVPLERPHVKQRLDKEIRKYQYYYSGNRLIYKRANRYREIFQETLREYGVPEDFFYLAVAESNLSNVVSPVGAKGFWQFMPNTALEYGLEVSATVDERLNPEKAAQAAAFYLLEAYDRFGDWALVAASYNMGQYGVAREVAAQNECDYFELDLNRETGNYLYRILTYKVILEHPAVVGLKTAEIDDYAPVSYRSVWVDHSIRNLHTFAREQGTDFESLKLLNPWLVAGQLIAKPGKTYEIRIPREQEFLAAELELDTYYWDLAHAETEASNDSTLESVGMEAGMQPELTPVDSLPAVETLPADKA